MRIGNFGLEAAKLPRRSISAYLVTTAVLTEPKLQENVAPKALLDLKFLLGSLEDRIDADDEAAISRALYSSIGFFLDQFSIGR